MRRPKQKTRQHTQSAPSYKTCLKTITAKNGIEVAFPFSVKTDGTPIGPVKVLKGKTAPTVCAKKAKVARMRAMVNKNSAFCPDRPSPDDEITTGPLRVWGGATCTQKAHD
jgi:hypothetical protein